MNSLTWSSFCGIRLIQIPRYSKYALPFDCVFERALRHNQVRLMEIVQKIGSSVHVQYKQYLTLDFLLHLPYEYVSTLHLSPVLLLLKLVKIDPYDSFYLLLDHVGLLPHRILGVECQWLGIQVLSLRLCWRYCLFPSKSTAIY